MATVEQWTGAARNLTDRRSGCLQIVRNIELSLEYVSAMIAKCDSGPNKEFLLKQQRVLEEALWEVKARIRQLFGTERPDASSSGPGASHWLRGAMSPEENPFRFADRA